MEVETAAPGAVHGPSHLLVAGLCGGTAAQLWLMARNEALLPAPRLGWRALVPAGVALDLAFWVWLDLQGHDRDAASCAMLAVLVLLTLLGYCRALPLRGVHPRAGKGSCEIALVAFACLRVGLIVAYEAVTAS